MSKELTPLEALEKIVDTYCIDNMDEEISIIETALKENQDIQSCFEYYDLSIKDIRRVCVSYKQREKHEKALEIIKEKQINVANFIKWLNSTNGTYEAYLQDRYQEGWNIHFNDGVSKEYDNSLYIETYCLTQEEYDLLKEVLV